VVADVPWVLRNARLHARDPSLLTAAGLAGALGEEADRNKVEAWEGGQVPLAHRVVRRYEDALDLPEGQLLRTIDLLTRDVSPIRSLPALDAPIPQDIAPEALPLLEDALQYRPMTGLDWDRLTTLLGSATHVLVRERDWESLLYRLCLEASVSRGLEYAHRREAAARLAGLPRSGQVVIEMAESALKDDDVQLYSDYASLLRYSPDPRGHHVLADVILRPPNGRALWASLSTMTTLVRHGMVKDALVRRLLPPAVGILADESVPIRSRRAAASFAERSDGYGSGDRLSLTAAERQQVTDLLEDSGLRPERQRKTFEDVIRSLADVTPSDATDPVLAALVRTSLGEAHLDTRDTALAVLMLSPQGAGMGAVLGAKLEKALADDDMIRAHMDLSMMSWLVQPSSLDVLTALTTDLSRPPEATNLAGAALGNCDEPAGPARAARDETLAAYARERIVLRGTDKGAEVENSWGVGYALGMRGRFDLIAELTRMPECGHDRHWSSSLGWWLELPEALRPAPAW
jgi:hypothetical protein